MKYKNNIPKTIHYCWFGEDEPSILSKKCISSWKKIMPDYRIKIHTEINTDFDTPLLKYLYEKKSWAFISDYIRLRVLYNEGGIYLDVDMEVLRPFTPLLSNSLFLGYESKGRLNSSILGSKPNETFLQKCMDYMDQRFLNNKPYKIAPEVISYIYNKYPNTVTVFEETYFYPYNPYDKYRNTKTLKNAEITKNTYTIHHWEKQWKMSWLERIQRKLL